MYSLNCGASYILLCVGRGGTESQMYIHHIVNYPFLGCADVHMECTYLNIFVSLQHLLTLVASIVVTKPKPPSSLGNVFKVVSPTQWVGGKIYC